MIHEMMDLVSRTDPEIADAIRAEYERQVDGLELIASENVVSEAVLCAMGSVLTNKYAPSIWAFIPAIVFGRAGITSFIVVITISGIMPYRCFKQIVYSVTAYVNIAGVKTIGAICIHKTCLGLSQSVFEIFVNISQLCAASIKAKDAFSRCV